MELFRSNENEMTVAIRDKHLIRLLEREARRRRNKTLTKTAAQLLTERFAQMELTLPPPRRAKAS